VEYFKKFDEIILKPILIHKYSKERQKRQWEFFDLLRQRGKKIEKGYVEINEDYLSKKDNENEHELLEVVKQYSNNVGYNTS
jgi:hypothetical protein